MGNSGMNQTKRPVGSEMPSCVHVRNKKLHHQMEIKDNENTNKKNKNKTSQKVCANKQFQRPTKLLRTNT